MADDLSSVSRHIREQNVLIPDVGPLSIHDLLAVGVAAVQQYSRADSTEPKERRSPEPAEVGDPAADPEVPPEGPNPIISADEEPDPLDQAAETLTQLETQLTEAEAEHQQSELDAMLDRLEAKGDRLAARSEEIQSALDCDDVRKLAELMGDELEAE
jgi:hypothetical protein